MSQPRLNGDPWGRPREPEPLEGSTWARMASMPHGTTINSQGVFSEHAAPPVIAEGGHHPVCRGNPARSDSVPEPAGDCPRHAAAAVTCSGACDDAPARRLAVRVAGLVTPGVRHCDTPVSASQRICGQPPPRRVSLPWCAGSVVGASGVSPRPCRHDSSIDAPLPGQRTASWAGGYVDVSAGKLRALPRCSPPLAVLACTHLDPLQRRLKCAGTPLGRGS